MANSNPPSSVGPPGYTPGDPDGVEYDPPSPILNRGFPTLEPSPWSGWPSEWNTAFTQKATPLVDTAWMAIDLQSSILSTLPTYLERNSQTIPPRAWMQNPNSDRYDSWAEFAKDLFWDYHIGEAFVLAESRGSDGFPNRLWAVPPYYVVVKFDANFNRTYSIGSKQIDPADILHIRYKTMPWQPRGLGPLDADAPRAVVAGLLLKLTQRIAEQGGTPLYWLQADRKIDRGDATALLDEWVDSRIRNTGRPALLGQGVTANTLPTSTREMALLELGQWTESRIAKAYGVPAPLMDLPSMNTMTYANISQLFDFHDRSSLRPKGKRIMAALSGWLLPRGTLMHLDSDEYTRPGMLERAQAYAFWNQIPGAITGPDVRHLERLDGEDDDDSDDYPATQPADSMQGGTGA
jgi:phage portal protein BeeE